ncbi:MAG: BlaI/MecI/CopY family transcriptional regulator [Planctomycetota bacterium]
MAPQPETELSRRERQIMDVIYARGRATAAEIRADLEDSPSDSAVRGTLRILGEKGFVKREADGPRFLYRPAVPAGRARRSALRRVLETFFGGRTDEAVAALLDLSSSNLSEEQLANLEKLIRDKRRSS